MKNKLKNVQVELLSGIDSMIINGESVKKIFSFAENGVKEILNDNNLTITYKSPYDIVGEENPCTIIATLKDKNEKLYIKHIILVCSRIVENTNEVENLLENIARQLNIALNKTILEKTHKLYSKTVNSLAIKYNATGIINSICSHLLELFPDHKLFDYGRDSKICVQILSNLINRNILVISGSTNKDNVGGTVNVDNSICGNLLKLVSCENIKNDCKGYNLIENEKDTLFYYLGNPNNNEEFMFTSKIDVKNEFDFIVKHEDETYSIVNIESSTIDSFRKVHVNVILTIINTLNVLFFSINQMKKKRTTTIYAIMRPYRDYVEKTIRIFVHNNSQPKAILNETIDHLEYIVNNSKHDQLDQILHKLNEIKEQQSDVEHMMSFSLRGMSTENTTSIQLQKVFDFIEKIIQEQIKTSNISFNVEIAKNFPPVFLNNIFFQYLYTIVQNSISSIMSKRDSISKIKSLSPQKISKIHELEELQNSQDIMSYQPTILLKASVYDLYKGEEVKDNFSENQDSLNLYKCKLEVIDNGMGIEENKLSELGKHKVSFTGGNGYALFALKQYLSCFNGQLHISSRMHKDFNCAMILNFYNSQKIDNNICKKNLPGAA